jgi:hypothetical protein
MKNAAWISLVAAWIGLSGCVAYPLGNYRDGRDRGAQRDRGQDRDNRDGNRDHRSDCDTRNSDCPRH